VRAHVSVVQVREPTSPLSINDGFFWYPDFLDDYFEGGAPDSGYDLETSVFLPEVLNVTTIDAVEEIVGGAFRVTDGLCMPSLSSNSRNVLTVFCSNLCQDVGNFLSCGQSMASGWEDE
jgi:hypothetical protein